MKHTTSVKKNNEQKQLDVAIKDLRKQQQQQQQEKSTEVEAKYKNLQQIHECTKKENKIYEAEILKLKHERDTAEEVIKALYNANFNKIQISSATDKEQQIQKLNTILEKEQGMKKIMAKDNIELKAQNQTLQTKMQENQEKYDEDLKVLHKAKEELQNQNKEQNQQLKRLLAEKDQHTKTILNTQSINNELEQQVTSLKRVNLELETTIHSLENSQIRRKPESNRITRENTSQTLDINDNNLSNNKQLKPVPQNKEKLCHACGSEKHETKDFESKRNIYIIDLKKPKIIEHKLRKELEKYGEIKSMRVDKINMGERAIFEWPAKQQKSKQNQQ